MGLSKELSWWHHNIPNLSWRKQAAKAEVRIYATTAVSSRGCQLQQLSSPCSGLSLGTITSLIRIPVGKICFGRSKISPYVPPVFQYRKACGVTLGGGRSDQSKPPSPILVGGWGEKNKLQSVGNWNTSSTDLLLCTHSLQLENMPNKSSLREHQDLAK